MITFEKTSLIGCDIGRLFDFHLDTNNIKKITPKHTKVELLKYDKNMFEGKVMQIKTIRAFIPYTWKVKIETLNPPHLLIDVALKSPFTYWEHHHIFTQKDDHSELKDIVNFKLPFGFIGNLAKPLIIKDIKSMFEYRHQRTKELLEA